MRARARIPPFTFPPVADPWVKYTLAASLSVSKPLSRAGNPAPTQLAATHADRAALFRPLLGRQLSHCGVALINTILITR